jgi:Ca2+-dependent lipid-binding protein
MDTFSKTDARIEVWARHVTSSARFAASDVIDDDLNPRFATSFSIPFVKGQNHVTTIEVFDQDGTRYQDREYIGEVTIPLDSLLDVDTKEFTLKSSKTGKSTGSVVRSPRIVVVSVFRSD